MIIGILISLIVGFLSFFSPCVLPIFPGYISFITGVGLEHLVNNSNANASKKIIISSIFFILGFSLIFILLGASASAIGAFLQNHISIISIIAGIGIIILGLHMIGILKIPFLYQEKKFHKKTESPGIINSFLAGTFFAFGWTPCIGPVLATILALAAVSENLLKGITLLASYAAGLAIPFLLSAIFLKFFIKYLAYLGKHLKKIEIMLGIVLIILGILIATNKLFEISSSLASINLDKLVPKSWANKLVTTNLKPKINNPTLEFTLPDINGKTQNLNSIGAKIIIINFWATWCPPCQYEMPELESIYKKYKNKGVQIIGIAERSNIADIKKFIQDKKITYSILIDQNEKVADNYKIIGLPATFILNYKGENLALYDGYTPPEKLENLILQHLSK